MMKNIWVWMVCVLLVGGMASVKAELNLVPEPQRVQVGQGTLQLSATTSIGVSAGVEKEFALFFADLLREATGWKVPVGRTGTILFKLDATKNIPEEGYQLSVTAKGVEIVATTQKGLFYGFQTLRQLMPPAAFGVATSPVKSWSIPLVKIQDAPRFAWRGILVDVSRKFQTPEAIKKLIDAMAACKLNTLHWHLTDDQGWRVEIKKYPKLTPASKPFYTQEQIRDVVRYAQLRNVMIVPEIDVPGHSSAAIRAYPELCCRDAEGNKLKRSRTYCPSDPFTMQFLEGVITELASLFPGDYIHLGADEVGAGNWRKCPDCQAALKKHKLKNTHELGVYFIQETAKLVRKQGKVAITWDEGFSPQTRKDQVIMSWRGAEPGMKAAVAGHKVVLCPVSALYFDRVNTRSKHQNKGYSSNTVTLDQVYFFEPQSPLLAPEARKNVLGAQGCIWGEMIKDDKHLTMQAMLRGCALAEATWSGAERRNWNNFLKRVAVQAQRLDAMKVTYFWEPMSNAIEISRIKPRVIATAKGTLSFDVTAQVKGNAMYEFIFHRYWGDGTFKVTGVELLENGTKVDSDEHTHTVTMDPRRPNQFYHLWVKDYKVQSKYTLRVHAEELGAKPFVGAVMLIPPLPKDEYSPRSAPETGTNGRKK